MKMVKENLGNKIISMILLLIIFISEIIVIPNPVFAENGTNSTDVKIGKENIYGQFLPDAVLCLRTENYDIDFRDYEVIMPSDGHIELQSEHELVWISGNGPMEIKGLPNDFYYLSEITAPEYYMHDYTVYTLETRDGYLYYEKGHMLEDNYFAFINTLLPERGYVIHYLEQGTEKTLADDKIESGLEIGSTVTEEAIDIRGYDKVSPTSTQLQITNRGAEYTFYYTPKAKTKYTVNYYEKGTTNSIASSRVISYNYPGDVITSSSQVRTISGYTYDSASAASITLVEDATQNVINLYYTKNETGYTVNYYEKGTNNVISTQKVVEHKYPGDIIQSSTEVKDIPLYTYDSASAASITLVEDLTQNVINLYYTKNKTSYTVNYYEKGTTNVIATAKVVTDKYPGDVITSSNEVKTIAGYTYDSASAASITLDEDATQNVINLYYTKNKTGYTVNYYEKGTTNVISTAKVVTDKYPGDVIQSSTEVKDIPLYTYDSASAASITLVEDLTQNVINLYYTKNKTGYTVNYYEKGTTNVIATAKVVTDKYPGDVIQSSTEVKDINGYVYDSTSTENLTLVEDSRSNIINIYYTKRNDLKYTVNYLEQGTNRVIHTPKNVENKTFGEVITSSSEVINLEKYNFVEADKESITIGTNANDNVINLYYVLKDTKVITKYLEKGTNEVLAPQKEDNYKVDDPYTTVKENIPNYTFVEDTNNTEGTATVNTITVTYYYLQNTSAKVEYIDKTTGRILDQRTENGLVGDIFETSALDFDNYILVEEPEEKNVPMQKQEVVLRYYYVHVSGGVIEKHIDVVTGDTLANEVHEGNEGEEYSIPAREFEGYDLVEERRPSNATGTMTVEPQEVKYYYIRKAKVIVKYIDKITGEELKNEVIKNGHQNDSYTTENETFEEYDLVAIPQNAEGRMEVTAVEENGVVTINNTTEVIYYYIHKSAGVTERHYDVITNELLEEEINHPGHEGDEYSISEKEFEGYDLVEERRPANAEGRMTIEEIIVNYYYNHRASVTTKYIDKITGEEIADREINNGYEGDNYTTIQKTIDGYDFVEAESPEKTEGVMTKNQIEIVYYYIRKAKVEVKYVDQTTEKEIAESDIINGHQNDEYLTTEKEIQYYKLVESTENITGKMEVKVLETEEKKLVNDTTTVIYYYRPLEFNLKVDKTISKILVNGEETNISNNNLAKVEIHRKKLADTTIRVEYIVKVSNDGELDGSTTLVERIPAGFVMKAEDNKDWNINNGIAEIKVDEIKVGETKEYKVVLEWLKGEENIGTKDNIVDIISSKNDAGFEEKTLDDNEDNATVILTVSTGENKDEILLLVATAVITVLGLAVFISISKKK